jgi:hypothetical protein
MASSMILAAGDPLGSALTLRNVSSQRLCEMFGLRSRRRCWRHDCYMPTISRFFGIAIVMFFDDHGFPHFHARHAEGEAKVRIDNLEVMDSNLGRRQLRFVLAWAELHQEELDENWRRARAGETLLDIEPLK